MRTTDEHLMAAAKATRPYSYYYTYEYQYKHKQGKCLARYAYRRSSVLVMRKNNTPSPTNIVAAASSWSVYYRAHYGFDF